MESENSFIDKSYLVSIAIVVATVFFLAIGCAGRKRGGANPAPDEDLVESYQSWRCPPGMAYVGSAGLCVDMFEYPNVSGEVPIGAVTWEMARDSCEAAGKRLPTFEEWERICAGKKERLYPYAAEYEEGRCHMDATVKDGPRPSGSFRTCGTEEGVFDLSGNLWEWTSTPGFQPGTFYVKGGAWWAWPSVATCDFRAWEFPDTVRPDLGFRCVVKP